MRIEAIFVFLGIPSLDSSLPCTTLETRFDDLRFDVFIFSLAAFF